MKQNYIKFACDKCSRPIRQDILADFLCQNSGIYAHGYFHFQLCHDSTDTVRDLCSKCAKEIIDRHFEEIERLEELVGEKAIL